MDVNLISDALYYACMLVEAALIIYLVWVKRLKNELTPAFYVAFLLAADLARACVLRLHGLALATGKPYRIAFLPTPVSHSRTPGTYQDLRRQAQQEQREIGCAFRNRVAIAGPFGWPALRGLYWERSLRPKLETAAYVLALAGLVAGWVDIATAFLVLLSTVAMGIVLSMAAVVLREVAEPASADERRMAALFLAAIPENLGYRQMRNLWLIAGFRKPAASAEQSGGRTAPQPPRAAASGTS